MMMGTILIAWAGLQGGMPGFSGGPEDFLLTEKQAYLVLPPMVAGGGQTGKCEWSPSGRYLLLFRATPTLTPAAVKGALQGTPPPEPRLQISIWDKTSAQTRDLATIDRTQNVGSITWMPNADVAYGLVDVPTPLSESGPGASAYRQDLVRIDAAKGELRILPLTKGGSMSFVQLMQAPGLGRLMALFTAMPTPVSPESPRPMPRHEILTIDSEGRMSAAVAIPSGFVRRHEWVESGRTVRFQLTQRDAAGQETTLPWAYDFAQGRVVSNAATLSVYEPPKKAEEEIEIFMMRSLTSAGTVRRTFDSAWLRSKKPSEQSEYLLNPRADSAILSPSGDAVAVIDQGVVTVRMLAIVSKDLYLQAKAAAERAVLMSQAKQVATGLHILAADTEDHFPTQEEWGNGSILMPYLKNDSLLKGFVYTFKGGSTSSVDRPAEQMIGYIPGPGGFAVAYLDGHVKWLPELPKSP